MPQQDKPANNSPFEIITPSKSKNAGKTGLIVGITIVVFLILSVVAGVLLVRQQQTITPKASVSTLCPGAEACPYAKDPTHLWDCHPAESDGTVNDHICNSAGYVATCGAAHTQYCCPSVGAAWTTDMTVCNSLAAAPTPTATPVLPSCGTVVPNCAQSSIPGSTACFDGQNVVYCCKAGQSITNGSCTNGGVGSAGLCDPNLAANGGCNTGLNCSCDGQSICRCGSGTSAPTATPTPTPSATSNASGNACNGTCGSNTNCQSGLYCYSGFCRNPLCASDSTCGCSSATATPTPTPTSTGSSTTGGTTAATQTTPLPVPVTGTDWPTVTGIGVGVAAIVISIILAL